MALSKLKVIERRNIILERVLKGERNKDIIDWICSTYSAKYNYAEKLVLQAKESLNEYRSDHVDQMLTLHLQRYEELFKLSNDIGMNNIAIKALQGKEKIIGLHKDEAYVKVNNEYIDATIVTPYDFKKLSKQENDRLDTLINKMQR